MSLRKSSEIEEIQANEGTKVKQIFHPHNTLEGINYSIAQFTLEPQKSTKLHKLSSSEIYFVLEGKAELKIEEDVLNLEKNDSVFVPPNSKQKITNTSHTDLRFLCIVEPAWTIDCEEILE